MARYKLQGRARDTWGNTISGLDIYVYVAGTSRLQAATVYSSITSTPGISATPQISSDTYGFFSFWVSDTDYVAATTKFDLYADGLEYTYIDIFNIKNHSILSGLPRNDHPQYTSPSASEVITGTWLFNVLSMTERSSDPTQPSEGKSVIWMSDGTGKGDDGDIIIASTAGGTTKYKTLFDHSSGTPW